MDKNNKKRNAVEWAMHYRQIIILVVCCLVAFGIYSLPEMRKNEFPDFTIRQGVVVAVAPGYTAEDMMEKVTKPLEEYIFTYKEVRKEKTFSKSWCKKKQQCICNQQRKGFNIFNASFSMNTY